MQCGKVGGGKLGRGRRKGRRDETADTLAPFPGAVGFLARKVVQPGPRMGVDHPERRGLFPQMHENADQDDMLEHVGKIAGMKGVTVVHIG